MCINIPFVKLAGVETTTTNLSRDVAQEDESYGAVNVSKVILPTVINYLPPVV
jgi:hypothetical protein